MSDPRIPTLKELKRVSYVDNNEPLIQLVQADPAVACDYRRVGTGLNTVLVRQSLVSMLQKVQHHLNAFNPKLKLLVVEGYRPPEFQERYFLDLFLKAAKDNESLPLDALLEHVHQCVALPSVAGHPTGGAVDVTIVDEEMEMDMGGCIADFTLPELLPTFSRYVSHEQAAWRLFLHDLMVAEGFAPFYGEWWHFSYGDREWAAFYGRSKSLYAPLYQ
jgi:D-alanyl-D-alanine dipeptidase